MRVIAHRGLRDVDVGWHFLDAYQRTVIDIGAGDGRFVVRRATAHPDWLVIGLDANAQGLYDGFRRAQKSTLANALFAVAPVEYLPPELAGTADEVRFQFPWGSLLTAVLRPDDEVVRGIAGLLRPGGTLTILVSVAERDGVAGVPALDARTIAGSAPDLTLQACRPATAADIAAAHSTWAKRLGAGSARTAWLLEYQRSTGLTSTTGVPSTASRLRT